MRITVIALPAVTFVVTPAVLALCADIQAAIERTRSIQKQSAAAAEMGVSGPRLSEFVKGESPLDVRRLAVLGDKNPTFWRELLTILADRHGFALVRKDLGDLVEGVDALIHGSRRRMAKAELASASSADERRSA